MTWRFVKKSKREIVFEKEGGPMPLVTKENRMKRIISIMAVEDDNAALTEIRRTLNRRNILYRLIKAANATEAFQILADEKSQPDILLLDLAKSDMNAVDFIRSIRSNARWKNIKVFVLTEFDRPVDKSAAHELGVSGFISRPLKLESPSSMDAYNLIIDLMNL